MACLPLSGDDSAVQEDSSTTLHHLQPDASGSSPTPRLDDSTGIRQGIQDIPVIENSESGTPNPKAAKRSKPIVHGPWNDIDDVGLFDDNGRPIILPEGNLPHPRLAPSQGYNGQPTTTQVPAGGGAKRQWKEFDSCNASNTGLGGLGLESRSPPLETHSSKKVKSGSTRMTDREWKFSIWDITRAIEHIKSASGRIEKLDSLVTNRPELPDSLSTEEKKTIEASLEANDSLSDAIQILSILRNDIRREAGEDSEDDEGDY